MQISWNFIVADAVRDTKNHNSPVTDLIFLIYHITHYPHLHPQPIRLTLFLKENHPHQHTKSQYPSGKEVIYFTLSVRKKKKNITQIEVLLAKIRPQH